MNKLFRNNWCVLHSYENLPDFSKSDVDMAFSSKETKFLETLIYEIADKTNWQVLQKLWYDLDRCYYFILKKKNIDIFLALDFLIDESGYGRYGLKSSFFTKTTKLYKGYIPIPISEIAFTYKFIKLLEKKASFESNQKYLMQLYDNSDIDFLTSILLQNFGEKSMIIINRFFENKRFVLDEKYYNRLIQNRRTIQKNIIFSFLKLIRNYSRLLFRIVNPSGMIVCIHFSNENKIIQFKSKIENKIGISFRGVKIYKNQNFINCFKWFAGSYLVIIPKNNISEKVQIHWDWFRFKRLKLNKKNIEDVSWLTKFLSKEIIDLLEKRKLYRK